MLLGVMAAAFGLVALAVTLTQRAVEYVSYTGPSGGPASTFTIPITLDRSSAPVILIGLGSALVCLGSQVDARIHVGSRVAPLVMLLSGVVFCAITTLSVSMIWLSIGSAPSDAMSRSADLSLSVVYIPVTLASGVCAIVALARHQSLRAREM